MIMRQWRGRVPRDKSEDYLSYLQATGLEEYRNTPGNLGAFVTTRPLGKATEFLLVTFWDSEDPSAATPATTTNGRSTIRKTASSC
jgi:heme-degrading monooxygenase HmoA